MAKWSWTWNLQKDYAPTLAQREELVKRSLGIEAASSAVTEFSGADRWRNQSNLEKRLQPKPGWQSEARKLSQQYLLKIHWEEVQIHCQKEQCLFSVIYAEARMQKSRQKRTCVGSCARHAGTKTNRVVPAIFGLRPGSS